VIGAHDGLVQENKPQYVTIKNKQWPIVSR
jgi:hypothetical protein